MPDADDVPTPEPEAAPLSRWERLGASICGAVLAGAGVVAVFLTSNQAGSVALLLVGVVLLIMAINGSPLTRARYQDYELSLARRRRQIAAEIEQESPAEARQSLQVLTRIDPLADNDPAVSRVSGVVYEREVVARLSRIYPDTHHRGGAGDLGIDAIVRTSSGVIGVQIKANTRLLPVASIRNILQQAASAHNSGVVQFDGLLVVTRGALPDHTSRRIREADLGFPATFVRWVDEQDDDVLRAKVEELTRRFGTPT